MRNRDILLARPGSTEKRPARRVKARRVLWLVLCAALVLVLGYALGQAVLWLETQALRHLVA